MVIGGLMGAAQESRCLLQGCLKALVGVDAFGKVPAGPGRGV